MRVFKFVLPALLVLGACLSTPASAATISITNVAVSTAGTTGDSTGGTARRVTSSSILDAGESTLAIVGAIVDGAARFSMAAETRAASGVLGTTQNDYNANYTVTFDVVTDPGVSWDLTISNSRIGRMLTGSGGGTGKADITASVGTVNGNPIPALGLADYGSLTSENGTSLINNTGSTVISGTGSASYTINVTWSSEADSTQGFLSKGDKVGVLIGNDIAWSETDAQVNYPNTTTRDAEGHYINFSAQVMVVPEPSTLAMGMLAGLGLVMFGWRRRQA